MQFVEKPEPFGGFDPPRDLLGLGCRVPPGDRPIGALDLKPRSVAAFHRELMATLKGLGLEVRINGKPSEIPDAIPFVEDETHAAYDPEYANRFWHVLAQSDRVFKDFRARFIGKCSPVHYFWGACDLAVTRFSGPVSAHRVFEAVGVPLSELKDIRRKVGDATINDLFLTIVGGALNRYLGARGELPAASIIAGVPMAVRGEDKTQEGNRIGMTLMPVHSEIADPLERLAAIRADAATAKRVSGALGKDLAMNALEHLPTPLADLLGHQSIDTTAIYTKVDLPALASVALPWPEGQP